MTRDQAATEARQAQSQLRAAYDRYAKARDPIACGRIINELDRMGWEREVRALVNETEPRK